jgi:hypothetical protein
MMPPHFPLRKLIIDETPALCAVFYCGFLQNAFNQWVANHDLLKKAEYWRNLGHFESLLPAEKCKKSANKCK